MSKNQNKGSFEGVLLIDKPQGKTSFSLVSSLRRLFNVQKIGHAGTLDPMATGVMVMLVGKKYTRLSDQFLCSHKEYLAEVTLGITTDSYDAEGSVTDTSPLIPTETEVLEALKQFQGFVQQVPPMFSAKKQQGQKLYDLARKGIEVERPAVEVHLNTVFIQYEYPRVLLRVECSKGTYIRSIAHDLGKLLGCGGHLSALRRTRSGDFHIDNCIDGKLLSGSYEEILPHFANHLKNTP